MHADELSRFTFVERVVHWIVGLSFVLLLLTGLAFSYPSLFWITTLVGGGPSARGSSPLDRHGVHRGVGVDVHSMGA